MSDRVLHIINNSLHAAARNSRICASVVLFVCAVSMSCSRQNASGQGAHSDAINTPRDPLAPYHGIDVSSHQKDINWTKVGTDSNIKFVYIKATEGSTYVSPHYNVNVQQARQQGILVGSYHYLRSTSSIQSQYRSFIKTAAIATQDLIPMIDVEKRGSWSRKQLIDSLHLLASLIERHYGVRPMIYSTMSFYNRNLSPYFNEYPLYIGRYSKKTPEITWNGRYTIWQYTETGQVNGISTKVDLCRFSDNFWLPDIALPKREEHN